MIRSRSTAALLECVVPKRAMLIRAGHGTRQCLIWLEILEVFVCSAINDWKVPRYL